MGVKIETQVLYYRTLCSHHWITHAEFAVHGLNVWRESCVLRTRIGKKDEVLEASEKQTNEGPYKGTMEGDQNQERGAQETKPTAKDRETWALFFRSHIFTSGTMASLRISLPICKPALLSPLLPPKIIMRLKYYLKVLFKKPENVFFFSFSHIFTYIKPKVESIK